MKEFARKKFRKRPFLFAKTTSDLVDLNDPVMVKEALSINPALLHYLYLKNNQKEEALNILKKYTRKMGARLGETAQVIYAHMYFKDYQGALDSIERIAEKIPEVVPIKSLIKIHLTEKGKGCQDSTVFNHVINGITVFYDKRLIKAVIDFYKTECKGCGCLKTKMIEIEKIILQKHMDELRYKDAKYLYGVMPYKIPFLRKMVETNPFIKKEHYFRYANVFGIHKKDILRILSARYRSWAMEIALLYGWVDPCIQNALEMASEQFPVFLNKEGDWNWNEPSTFRFSVDVLFEPENMKDGIEFSDETVQSDCEKSVNPASK